MKDFDPAEPLPSSQALPEGTCLEGFAIESVLGSGSFTHTYLARDIELGKLFVLKEHLPEALCYRDHDSLTVVPKDPGGGNEEHFAWSVWNFAKEAEAIASLHHPGIVRILGGFECFGTAYFVMPFVVGASLEEQVQIRHAYGPEFTEEELTGLLWRMLEALNFLHDRGIYHLGIRPENIILNEEGIPSLIGFSGARRLLCGRISIELESPGYTPVEQTKTFTKIGPQSDIYALGATLFASITGNPPAVATPLPPWNPLIPLAQREELQKRFSQKLLRSIDKALDPVPEERYREGEAWRRAVWGNVPAEEPRMILPSGWPAESSLHPKKSAKIHSPEESSPSAEESAKVTREVCASVTTAIPHLTEGPRPELIAELPPSRSRSTSRRMAAALVLIGILAVGYGYLSSRKTPSKPAVISTSMSETELTVSPPAPPAPEPALEPEPPSSPVPVPVAALATPAREEPEPIPATEQADMSERSPDKTADAELVEPVEMEGKEAGEIRQFGGIEMAWCPPGTFSMGSPWNEKGRFMDETPHQVTLTRGYWMAKTETTQPQWERIMEENPSLLQGENLPVERVTWLSAQRWLEEKNVRDPLPGGWKWSLPTEAQWEYACRAGTTTAIYSGPLEILGERNAPALDEIAWYGGNSSVGYSGPGVDTSEWEEKQYPGGTAGVREVGRKLPNAWGLHDMMGNVWEWCADWFGPYQIGATTDPEGPATGVERVMRGGNWANSPDVCRSAVRSGESPGGGGDGLGFRCVAVPPKNSDEPSNTR